MHTPTPCLYSLAAKWTVTSPEIMKKNEKQREKNKKSKETKERKAKEAKEAKAAKVVNASKGGASSKSKGGKRKKKETEDEEATDDDHSIGSSSPAKKCRRSPSSSTPEPAAQITVYIHVRKNAPPSTTTRSKAKAPVDEWLPRDPFRFSIDEPYDSFIRAIADALPCKLEAVPASDITWKPRVPQNAKPLKLGGTVGFEGMIETFAGKKDTTGRQLLLYMPPPAKPAEDKPVRPIVLFFYNFHTNICAYI